MARAVQARPNFVQARILLADTKTSIGQPSAAADELRALAEEMPQNVEIQLKLARALLHEKGKSAEGYEVAARASEMDSITIAQFEHAQRMLRAAPGELREAVARGGIRRFPLHAPMYLSLAEVLEETDRREEALAVLSKGAEQHKPPPALYLRLSQMLIEDDRRAEALPLVQAARAQVPNDAEVQRLLTLLQTPPAANTSA